MSKFLYIGDVHAVASELEDCVNLIDEVIEVAVSRGVQGVRFSGDLFHQHDVVSVKVLDFWWRSFERIKAAGLTIDVLVGNHDQTAPGDPRSALGTFRGMVTVIEGPTDLGDGVLGVPYMEPEEFLKVAGGTGHHTLFCHQTFAGARFDNNFYAPEGITTDLGFDTIIAGHIHMTQQCGPVVYIGAPRWRTASDANQDRFLWVFEHTATGTTVLAKVEVRRCKKIWLVQLDPSSPESISKDLVGDVRCDLRGPKEFVSRRATELRARGFKVREFPDAEREVIIKESDRNSLKVFFDNYVAPQGTPAQVLEPEVRTRLGQ